MNDQWYAPLITSLLGLGLFWILTTPLVGAIVYPRRLSLPWFMRWSHARFPTSLSGWHRAYVVVGNLVLEVFPIGIWWAGDVAGGPLRLPSEILVATLSVLWILLLLRSVEAGDTNSR